jgi:solute:Na+ symporter, SSS family
MGTIDWILLAAYLGGTVYFGLRFAGKQEGKRDFFVGGKSMHWFPVMASLIATGFSAISFMGSPAQVFQRDLQLFSQSFFMLLFGIPVALFVIPRIYKYSEYTVYEFLELRYNVILRSFASLLFMLSKGLGWFAAVMYIPSLALQTITGIPVGWCIVIIGICTTGYIIKGGIKSVIWADTMQFFVILIGIVALMWCIMSGIDGGIGEVWRIAEGEGRTRIVNMKFSIFEEFTVWCIMFGVIFNAININVADQIRVQRFLSAKSAAQAVKSMIISVPFSLGMAIMLNMIGLGLVAYYKTHPALAATLENGNQVLPHFIVNVLPKGISGLVIASIFAAAMSSASSAINSLSTTSVIDFYQRLFHRPWKDDVHYMKVGRIMTFVWGVIGTLMAFGIDFLSKNSTIWQAMGTVMGMFAGPLVGMYVLGYFAKRSTSEGVFIAAFATLPFMFWIKSTPVSWMWYGPFGLIFSIVVGYILSILFTAVLGPKNSHWLDALAHKKVTSIENVSDEKVKDDELVRDSQ